MAVDNEWRGLSAPESALIIELIHRSSQPALVSELEAIGVRNMDDGGMRSLLLVPKILSSISPRSFGRQLSDLTFVDADLQPVSAALNVDSDGHLFELDMFKADFSPLIAIPDALTIAAAPAGPPPPSY
jgi:hypothetical protein